MGSDAEYMYEHDLDPLYRKDRSTGQLVEWEGGLNPIYRESNIERKTNIKEQPPTKFHNFQEAKKWAKENPGRAITKSPDGNGYIIKDSQYGSTGYNTNKKSDKQYNNIRPCVYKEIKNYLTREKAEANNFHIYTMKITEKLAKEIKDYISDEDLQTYSQYRKNKRSVNFTYTPNFSVKMYIKDDGSYSMCLIDSGARGHSSDEEYNEKAKRCKTKLDLYFDILRKSPNDLMEVSFSTDEDDNDEVPF
jgi:hypothetical protein